ncbi:3-oxoacyl-[acyl-carrier-protein] synthase-3 [Enterococcus sp. PF1-24]|uniref:beta-ketoacyl-ACP synthase III n=1 Tax=unclassified Enterococcus TaxID=2608891 RepID=UPI0024750576|nr:MULTISPECIES: beta-ketoacyl-ACP synthase III [unclassified Enterococcus]MDH6363640.1 3-oxoacyl-[acyl-carrier-protein] synthase-3 [Enterococcus sp. PFB1-1]MDH6400875.1 3-oxoacyl-[acyl-carrier-protein] synthase-3 [Enterococcus sp. PF1-24]
MESYGRISATASYVPEKVVTNDDLASIMDTSDEWIYSRTGIKERRCVTNQTTSDLCIEVAKKLLAKQKLSPESLDFIIVATMSPDYTSPSVACMVQGAIGAKNALAFDISAACSGFVYALATGDKFIRTGSKRGLIIGGETISKILNWQDRSTAVLFGDGAGGVLMEADSQKHLLKENLMADGTRSAALTAGEFANNSPFWQGETVSDYYLQMNGRDIFDFATRDVVKNILATVADEKDEVDFYLLHQANQRIIEKIARKLKVPSERFLMNMGSYGNTSAASIAILLDEMVAQKKIQIGSNQKLVLTGYGGGLTWGSLLIAI